MAREPTRWATVRGKRIPIHARAVRRDKDAGEWAWTGSPKEKLMGAMHSAESGYKGETGRFGSDAAKAIASIIQAIPVLEHLASSTSANPAEMAAAIDALRALGMTQTVVRTEG